MITPSQSLPSATFRASSEGNMVTGTLSSVMYAFPIQARDFNNVTYAGCVLKNSASGHTYIRFNMTLTNRLNATVHYVNASIIFQASEISNGFRASESYAQLVAGPTNTSVLGFPIELPVDNVVSGSLLVQVFIRENPNQIEAIRLQPSISVAPSDYPQCSGN
jgi:hypothetical protein